MRPGNLLPAREMTIAWPLMLLLALLAWLLVVGQADDTEMGPGAMGLGLPLFLLLWVIMMAAMMFPSVSPVAITWVRPSAVSRPAPSGQRGPRSSWADT